ncbi:MAG: DegT/DnrJ/EryC1/StrS family aminotransferase [Magnetococcales bacterium]|nr:DegT/DnrJ/EryC1/StrS family aminotransferase [Magnetococcales bacterium]NGZ28297.1 DegT/DnrJ/EryC1/StrS family aminotransferase [Magnetococcales bacterium]
MNPRIPIALPTLGKEEADAAGHAILSNWVTQGPKVLEFEAAFANRVHSSHACALSSCTTALHLALKGVGVTAGDVVLTPSHTFIATANAIRYCGAEPWFIDIEADTLNISPDKIQEFLHTQCRLENPPRLKSLKKFTPLGESPLRKVKRPSGRIAAILAVHQIGMPADLARLRTISQNYHIPLVEDAACAIGSSYQLDGVWHPVGKPVGKAVCFSFHPRKILTTGDGGMLTTDSVEMDRNCRLWRQHGMSVSDLVRHGVSPVQQEEYVTTGFNYRLTDIQAAVGVVQLSRLDSLLQQRHHLVANYLQGLAGVEALRLPHAPDYGRTNWQTFMVSLRKGSVKRRDRIMQQLHQQGIATRPGIMCCHRCPPYQAAWKDRELPESSKARDRGIALPLYHQLRDEDQQRVVDALLECLQDGKEK